MAKKKRRTRPERASVATLERYRGRASRGEPLVNHEPAAPDPLAEWIDKVNAFCDEMGWPRPVKLPGSEMRSMVTTVTPENSLTILEEHHIENNRPRKEQKLASYARDMELGVWEENHQGIAFDANLDLFDGQNRSYASLEREVAYTTMVTFLPPALSEKAKPVTDTGASRNFSDAARILGLDTNTRFAPMVRSICFGYKHMALSHSAIIAISQHVADAIKFVQEAMPQHLPRISTQTVLGAIGRAYYHVDHDRLREFCACLQSGVVNGPEDKAAALLLRFLHTNAVRGHEARQLVYAKTANAIKHFIDRTPVANLYASGSDPFPLPEDIEARIDSEM